MDMRTITFLLLLWQTIVIVRPEDGVDDGVNKRNTPWDGYLRFTTGAGTDIDTGTRSYFRSGEKGRAADATSQKKERKIQTLKKPRFLCLHGASSNAAAFEKELNVWPKSVIDNMELVFINGPIRVNDSTSSSINGHFKWFTLDKGTYKNFNESIAYIEDLMVELGPFDGVIGFSQGSVVAGALPGMQEQGVCLTRVGKIKHVVIISGAKFGGRFFSMPKLAETAYSSPINIPSLHIFGEHDEARLNALELVEAYVDPLVIYHHGGHEVPKLDEEGMKIMYEFLQKINVVL